MMERPTASAERGPEDGAERRDRKGEGRGPSAESRELFTTARGLRTRYLEWPGGEPPVVLLHGLSANANEFVALGAALSARHRVVAPDLRGRGGTDKPATGYSMADHAADVVALLDALGLGRVVLGGHSFGGLLTTYVAAHYPDRVERLFLIDAAIHMHPEVREMLKPSLARLRQTHPSVEAYLDQIRRAPYVDGQWDWAMESYYRAEVRENPDGSARSATSADAIAQALDAVTAERWAEHVARVRQPALLLNATGAYGPPGSPALVPEENARATATAFRDARYVQVPGNHLTMVFGDNAAAVVREVERFLAEGAARQAR